MAHASLSFILYTLVVGRAYFLSPEIDSFYYGTKTAYNLTHQQMPAFIKDTLHFQDVGAVPEECGLVQMNVVFRHGTRHPSHGDVSKIDRLLSRLKGLHLRNSALKSWTNSHTMEVEKILTASGREENREIARKLYLRYGSLLSKSLTDLDRVYIFSSETQRTEASAAAFIEGLLVAAGRQMKTSFHKKLDNRVTFRQDLLRFFDYCRQYNDNMEDSQHWLHQEFDSFENSQPMEAAADRVSKRLFDNSSGDTHSAKISPGEMKVIWALCGCELAIYGVHSPSPWCTLFTEEDRKVLEYFWDLKSYWKKSYGESLNYKQSCPLLRDLYEKMDDARSETGSSLVNLYFGHAETLLPLQALLGLFKDTEELNVRNYERLAERRRFRSSFLVPFAGNLGLYLFKCQPVEQNTNAMWPGLLDKYMVQLQLNEHVIPFPFTNLSAISLASFEEQYLDEINSCDFHSLCKNVPRRQEPKQKEPATTNSEGSAGEQTTPGEDDTTDKDTALKKPVDIEAGPPEVPNVVLNNKHDEF